MCEDARELIKDKWIKEVDKNGEKEKRGRTKLETTKATAGGIGTCTIWVLKSFWKIEKEN